MSLPDVAARPARYRICGWTAAVWAAIFAVLHFYWALGGQIGLAVSAGPDLAAQRPAWFVAGGLWGVGLMCVAGALTGRELARNRLHGTPGRLIRVAALIVGPVLLLRAATVELLLLAGSSLNDTVGPAHRFWTLTVWNPWFAVGGIAFLLAGLGYRWQEETAVAGGPSAAPAGA